MILLEENSLTPKRKVPLEAMSLTVKERESSASITPSDMTGIAVNAWLKDESGPGIGMVWRVRSIQRAYATDTPTVQLETVLNTLRDRILFGEVTPATITGKKVSTCTAKQAVAYIIGKQSVWKLGDFEDNPTNAYKFDGDDLFSALETVTSTMKDVYWVCDFSSYPFTLHFRKLKNDDNSELRPGRNLITISRTVDKTGMFTRFYPIGAGDLHLGGGGYVSRNESTYGVIEKVDTDSTLDTEAELRTWANTQLDLHAEPSVTVDVDGLELSDATGEPMDDFTIMRVCRIPLEEFNTTIRARIVGLNYPDVLRDKMRVKITLSNSRQEVTKIIADMIRRSGKGARTGARKDKQGNAWMENTGNEVAMCARSIGGTDANGNPDWSKISQIVVSGQGISQSVEATSTELGAQSSRIEMTESSITQTVKAVGKDGKITAGSICLSINKAGSSARINADHIVLKGTSITLESLFTVVSGNLVLKKNLFMNLSDSNHYIQTKRIQIVGASSAQGAEVINLSAASLRNAVSEAKVVGNELKLTLFNGDEINFSKATALSGAWSGGKYTITATPQNEKTSIGFDGGPDVTLEVQTNGTGGVDAYNDKFVDAPLKVVELQGQSEPLTRYTFTRAINATAVWDKGHDQGVIDGSAAGRNATKVKDPTWSTTPSSGITGNSNTATFTTDAPNPVSGAAQSLMITLGRSSSWSSGTRYVYATHTDSADAHRIARIDVTIPDSTVQRQIYTYGNNYPTSIDGGNISKSGITAGKYMVCVIRTGGKDTNVRFLVVA